MNTVLKNALLVCVAAFLLTTGPLFAATRIVDPAGGAGIYTTIQAAVNDAAAGDKIFIRDATYNETITVGKNNISFEGASAAGVVLAPTVLHTGNGFTVTSTGVGVKNMTVKEFNAGFYANGSTGLVLDNIVLEDNLYGLYSTGSAGIFENLTVADNGRGVYLGGGNANEVTGCVFTGNTTAGVEINGAETALNVHGNRIVNNPGVGIKTAGDISGDITGNTVAMNTGYGMNVGVVATGTLYIWDNCLWENGSGTAQVTDANPYGPTYPVYWFKSGVGNYYNDYNLTAPYATDGAGNRDYYPLTGSNDPTGSANVALNQNFTVDMVYTVPGCDPMQNMKGFDFSVTWDPTLLILQSVTEGNYLPGTTGFVYDDSQVGAGVLHVTNASLDSFAVDPSGVLAHVNFMAVSGKVGTATIAVNSQYVDKYNKNMATTSTPLAVTVKDGIVPWFNTATGISGSPLGTVYSAAFPVNLHYDVGDDFGLWGVQYNIDGGAWQLAVGSLPAGTKTAVGDVVINVAALVSGPHTLNLRVYDNGPAWNFALKAIPFDVDNTAPPAPSFTLEDNDGCAEAGWTSGRTVKATVATSYGATDTKIAWTYAGPSGGDTINFASVFTFSLNDYDGTHGIYMKVLDVYGNESGWSGPVNIDLDRSAPAPSGFTLPSPVNVTTMTGNVTFYGGSNFFRQMTTENVSDISCSSTLWGPMTTSPTVTIAGTPEGPHTVYYAVRDYAGNVGYTTAVTVLDQVAPEFTVFDVQTNNGEPCENDFYFKIHMEFEVAGDAGWVSLTTTSGALTWGVLVPDSVVGTIGYKDTIYYYGGSWIGDGTYTVYGRLSDALNNYSAEVSDGVFVDGSAVSAGTMAVVDRTSGGVYSDESTVEVTLSGAVSADIIHVRMAETAGGLTTAAWVDYPPATTLEFTYAPGVAECGWVPLYLEAKDCAGHVSPSVNAYVLFDLQKPVLSLVTLDGGVADTNNPVVTVALTATDNCPWIVDMMYSTDPGFAGASWTAYAASFSYTFTGGDGTRTLYVKVRDIAGNESDRNSATIHLDSTPPSCTVTITAPSGACPDAVGGYTCDLNGCTVTLSDYPGDVEQMYIYNPVGGANTGWIPFQDNYTWNLAGPEGSVQVYVSLLDNAGNQTTGVWNSGAITYDITPPPAPAAGSAVPGGSIALSWQAVTDAQFYQVNYQRWNDYPWYLDPAPTAPATVTSPFVGATKIAGTSVDFDAADHQKDIYFLSVFACDMAGNWSTTGLPLTAPNYVLGDFNFDGDLDFGEEFGALAAAFYSVVGDANWDAAVDIGPTSDGTTNGYPLADSTINFADLLIFAFNYDVYASKMSGAPKTVPLGVPERVVVSVDMPNAFSAGDEINAVVRMSDAALIKGMSFTLPYDSRLLEPVAVTKGSMFSQNTTILFNRITTAQVNLDGVVLGSDARFDGQEVAVITFRAKAAGMYEFKDVRLDVRDCSNNSVPVEFNTVLLTPAPVIPTQFALGQNYPNPFNPTTNIDLSLPVACEWRVDVYNITGQVVRTFSGNSGPGIVTVTWDGTDSNNSSVASGIYFYKAVANGGQLAQTRKMVLMK